MSGGGTPLVALTVTSAIVVSLIVSGTFEQIVALGAVLFLLYYVLAFAAVFTLRQDPRSGLIAVVFLAACARVYSWTARRRRSRAAAAARSIA